jgi:L-arabinose isomerase
MAGGTHHSAMCYTPDIGEIKKFSQLMGWNTVVI